MNAEKYFISLELDKILKMLSDTASSADAKEMALGIKPLTDYFAMKAGRVIFSLARSGRRLGVVWEM